MSQNFDDLSPPISFDSPLNPNYINIRDRLFHSLFVCFSLIYAQKIPLNYRRLIEFLVLIKAIVTLFILSYIHIKFVKSHVGCLDHMIDKWPRDGILRVEIVKNAPQDYNIIDSYRREREILHLIYKNGSVYDEDENPHLKIKADNNISNIMNFNHTSTVTNQYILLNTWPILNYLASSFMLFIKTVLPSDEYIVEYSLEYGFLRLSPATRERLNIPIMVATLDPEKAPCFGNSFTKFLLQHFHGYDAVLMASIKNLAEMENDKGFLCNVITGQHFRYVKIYTHRTSYIMALFFMILFTVVVSILIRYSHQQIFLFIMEAFQFLGRTSADLNYFYATLLTVVLAFVGLESLMVEFFSDTTTTFYIIFVIWVADQYDSVCCLTYLTKKHWLKFFYLYHYVFYAYHHRFKGQYNALAFVTSGFFILHSMIYFYHHYELPYILAHYRYIHPSTADLDREEHPNDTGEHLDVDNNELQRTGDDISVGEGNQPISSPNIGRDFGETDDGDYLPANRMPEFDMWGHITQRTPSTVLNTNNNNNDNNHDSNNHNSHESGINNIDTPNIAGATYRRPAPPSSLNTSSSAASSTSHSFTHLLNNNNSYNNNNSHNINNNNNNANEVNLDNSNAQNVSTVFDTRDNEMRLGHRAPSNTSLHNFLSSYFLRRRSRAPD